MCKLVIRSELTINTMPAICVEGDSEEYYLTTEYDIEDIEHRTKYILTIGFFHSILQQRMSKFCPPLDPLMEKG